MEWLTEGRMIDEIKNGQVAEGQDEQRLMRQGDYLFWVDDDNEIMTNKGLNGYFVHMPYSWDYRWRLLPLIRVVE